MADIVTIHKEICSIVEHTEGIHLMPDLNSYGQLYPAVYFDNYRALYNGDSVAFTIFALNKALPKERIGDVQQELGREVSEGEMQNRYKARVRNYQQNTLSPICLYVINVLTGGLNANLSTQTQYKYKLRKGRQMPIDNFSVIPSGQILPYYEALVTIKGLTGIAYDIEVEGGHSLYPTFPAMLKTNWSSLAEARKQQIGATGGNKKQSGGIYQTENLQLPKGAIIINRQNFSNSIYRQAKNVLGRELIAALGKWNKEWNTVDKILLQNNIVTALGHEGASLHKQGNTYYILPIE